VYLRTLSHVKENDYVYEEEICGIVIHFPDHKSAFFQPASSDRVFGSRRRKLYSFFALEQATFVFE